MQAVVDLSGGLYILPDAVAAAGLAYGDCLDIHISDGRITLDVRPGPVAVPLELRLRAVHRRPGPVVVAAEDIAAIDGA